MEPVVLQWVPDTAWGPSKFLPGLEKERKKERKSLGAGGDLLHGLLNIVFTEGTRHEGLGLGQQHRGPCAPRVVQELLWREQPDSQAPQAR